jgi:probable rRNA maturation factor
MDDETVNQRITVQTAQLCDKADLDTAHIEQLVNSVCARFSLKKAVISIAVVDDERMYRLNEQFLKRKKNTDCLSFDLSEDQNLHEKCFEIIVNAEQAARCAGKTNHSPRTELALYITHGLLHQFGFDDRTCARAEEMHRTEEQILQQLGYNFAYN